MDKFGTFDLSVPSGATMSLIAYGRAAAGPTAELLELKDENLRHSARTILEQIGLEASVAAPRVAKLARSAPSARERYNSLNAYGRVETDMDKLAAEMLIALKEPAIDYREAAICLRPPQSHRQDDHSPAA